MVKQWPTAVQQGACAQLQVDCEVATINRLNAADPSRALSVHIGDRIGAAPNLGSLKALEDSGNECTLMSQAYAEWQGFKIAPTGRQITTIKGNLHALWEQQTRSH